MGELGYDWGSVSVKSETKLLGIVWPGVALRALFNFAPQARTRAPIVFFASQGWGLIDLLLRASNEGSP